MVFHETPKIEAERTQRRLQLMTTIAAFKRSKIASPRLIRQLEYELEKLGGPIDE